MDKYSKPQKVKFNTKPKASDIFEKDWCKDLENRGVLKPEKVEEWRKEFRERYVFGDTIYFVDGINSNHIEQFICKTRHEAKEEGRKEHLMSIDVKIAREMVKTGEIGKIIEEAREEMIKEIAKDIVKIIAESKATFFGDKDTKIPTEELLFELRAEIMTNCELYLYKLLK